MAAMTICLLALGLSMDAFAVSLSNGFSVHGFGRRDMVRQAIYFGSFQFLMPVTGWYLGSQIEVYLAPLDHWVAFGLLAAIGGNMIRESLLGEEQQEKELTGSVLFMQAVATSIDAMAAGVSFAFLQVHIMSTAAVIGVISFAISFAGGIIGNRMGNVLQTKAELLGGIVLILMGCKILIEHLLFNH